jgi:hypothetical protein
VLGFEPGDRIGKMDLENLAENVELNAEHLFDLAKGLYLEYGEVESYISADVETDDLPRPEDMDLKYVEVYDEGDHTVVQFHGRATTVGNHRRTFRGSWYQPPEWDFDEIELWCVLELHVPGNGDLGHAVFVIEEY